MRTVAITLSVLLIANAAPLAGQAKASAHKAPPPAVQSAPAPVPPAPVEAETVHVITGRSMIIASASGLKRVLVSNPDVVEAVIASPMELVISTRAAGTSSVVVWQSDGRMRMLDVYSDLDVSGLRSALNKDFPGSTVTVDSEQGRVQLHGRAPSQTAADAMMKMAATYSKDVVDGLDVPVTRPRTQQVMLKVRFAEVDRARLSQWGVNFLSTGAGNTIGTTSTQQYGSNTATTLTGTIPGTNTGTKTTFNLSDLLNVFIFRPDLNFGAEIKDLQQKNVLQILAEPNLMAVSGEPARFLAGGEFPFPVVQGLGNGSATAVTLVFKPYGVRLEFTATVEEGGLVRMRVLPEVSALDYTNAVTVSGFQIPALSTRRAETVVELHDGQSFGIAGLLDDRTTAALASMPGFANIPILGQLFRSKSVNRTNSELMVLVTPTIVDPASVAAPALPRPSMSTLDTHDFDREVGGSKAAAEKSAAK